MVKTHTKNSRGFTLLELVVTIAIFTMMLGIALSNYGSFSRNALFANDAESVALSLREAQVYGTGSKKSDAGCGDPGGNNFTCVYGVHFEKNENQYMLFVDKDNSGAFNTGEDFSTVTFSKGATISNLECGEINTPCGGYLDVTFKRPSPDAIIKDNISTGDASYTKARISVTNGVKTSVTTVVRAGQISTAINEE